MDEIQMFRKRIEENIRIKQALLEDETLLEAWLQLADDLAEALHKGQKALFCGNGGSAADAQHIAAELSGRFYLDRPALFAEALHVNTSFLTAVANDYGFEQVYARMVEAGGRKGDYLFALSTSGNSANVLAAARKAVERGMKVVGMTGEGGGALADFCDLLLAVPSRDTARIQECHIFFGHLLCERIEVLLFSEGEEEP